MSNADFSTQIKSKISNNKFSHRGMGDAAGLCFIVVQFTA